MSNTPVSFAGLQVLQYDDRSGTWSLIGKQKKPRRDHAIVEAIVPPVCGVAGNLSPDKIINDGCNENYDDDYGNFDDDYDKND